MCPLPFTQYEMKKKKTNVFIFLASTPLHILLMLSISLLRPDLHIRALSFYFCHQHELLTSGRSTDVEVLLLDFPYFTFRLHPLDLAILECSLARRSLPRILLFTAAEKRTLYFLLCFLFYNFFFCVLLLCLFCQKQNLTAFRLLSISRSIATTVLCPVYTATRSYGDISHSRRTSHATHYHTISTQSFI